METLVGTIWEQREAVIRLVIAAALGAVVGIEREGSGKPAGFRTNLLICLGAALLTILSIEIAEAPAAPGAFRSDPGRIAAQIVSGIGFLGAGTIIQARGNVIGLTTAASLWVVAAIGMVAGAGRYVTAFAATALVVLALRLLVRLEGRLDRRARSERTFEIELRGDAAALAEVERELASAGQQVELREVRASEDGFLARYSATGTRAARDAAMRALLARPGVRRISLR